MEKYYEEWDGKMFPVREVMLPEKLGGFVANVATSELWDAIEDAYNADDKIANNIDDSIYFYCGHGFIESDPTDEEIVEYLIKNVC
jgi:hypothetical protein